MFGEYSPSPELDYCKRATLLCKDLAISLIAIYLLQVSMLSSKVTLVLLPAVFPSVSITALACTRNDVHAGSSVAHLFLKTCLQIMKIVKKE